MTQENQHTSGNYFVVGVPGKDLRSHSPYFGVSRDIMIAHTDDFGRFDPNIETFWVKVPAFIPPGPDRRWQPMGGEQLEMHASTIIHCRDGREIEVRKGGNWFPDSMHLKSTPIMLPFLRMPAFMGETDEEEVREAA